MNQFNQMGMQSMGQRSTPPLPMGATGNQVRTELNLYTFFNLKKIKLSAISWQNATQPTSKTSVFCTSRWEWLDPGWASPTSINFRISICPRDSFLVQVQELDQLSLVWPNLVGRQEWLR